MSAMSGVDGPVSGGLQLFSKLQRENVEALRYRAEDVGRSLTSKVIKEVRLTFPHVLAFSSAFRQLQFRPYTVCTL